MRIQKCAAQAIGIVLIASFSFAQSKPDAENQKKMIDALVPMGVAAGSLFYTAAKGYDKTPSADAGDKLNKIVSAYQYQRDTQRGTVALLDTTFEVALTGTDIATAGESMLATSGVRFVKNKALGAMTSKMDADARHILATELRQFEQQGKLRYDDLARMKPEEISRKLDSLGVLNDVKSLLTDDPKAAQVIDKSVIGLIQNTSKATLYHLAQTQEESARTKAELKNLSKSVDKYMRKVDGELQTLTDSLHETQEAVSQAQASLDSLRKKTEKNSEQLEMVSNFMFSRATAQERLEMLNQGYLKDKLGSAFDDLKAATAAEAKREKLMGDISQVVSTFSQFAQIAQNLGVKSPELQAAVRYATVAQSTVNDVLKGNYLGAVVGVTGIFGGGQSAEAAFQQRLMSYLAENFQKINEKLDTIIEGERRLMQGIVSLSQQMAEYDRALHQRLDRMEFTLDTIESLARQTLYWPVAGCQTTQGNIAQTIYNANLSLDLRNFAQLKLISSSVRFDSVIGCAEYLETLYSLAFDYSTGGTSFSFDPLSIRLSKKMPGDTNAVSAQDQQAYFASNVQQFMEQNYAKPAKFVLTYFPEIPAPSGSNNQGTATTLTAILAIPSKNIESYRNKVKTFVPKTAACVAETFLSEPMIQVLCTPSGSLISATRTSLPKAANDSQEQSARLRAEKILRSPLMHDSLTQLAQWAMFWAPLYDYSDLAGRRLLTSEDEFFAMSNIQPKGPRLLNGALKTLTFGISQMDIAYGDSPAAMVFDTLWDSEKGLPATEAEVTDAKKKEAVELLKLKNGYLRRNVLMFALDKAAHVDAQRRPLGVESYRFALEFMQKTAEEHAPEAQLVFDFDGKIKFTNVWVPKDGTADCSKDTAQCYRVPHAVIAGVAIPLPSSDDFALRKLTYPRTLLDLMQAREQVVDSLADYAVLDSAVVALPAKDRAKAKRGFVEALVSLQK